MNFLKKCIMYFTLQEREKRFYNHYEQKRQKLESLTDRQLHERYIRMKATYEYKKNFLTLIIVTLFLSILTGIWKFFYNYMKTVLELFLNETNSIEITQIIVNISVYLLITIVVCLFVCMVIYLKNLYKTYEELLLVEEIRNRNNN